MRYLRDCHVVQLCFFTKYTNYTKRVFMLLC